MATELLSLTPGVLAGLRTPPSEISRVLSIYLDTSRAGWPDRAYLLAYRDLLKALRPRLLEADSEDFERAASALETYLTQDFVPGPPMLALFATSGLGPIDAVALRSEVPEGATWDDLRYLEPLERALNQQSSSAVVLFDSARARIFTIEHDEIDEHRPVEDRVEARHKTAGWAALEESRFAHHRENTLARHAQHTVDALVALSREVGFEWLFLAGPAEAIAALRPYLTRSLRARLAGELHLPAFAHPSQVLSAARTAIETAEQQFDLELVDELLNAATGKYAILGVAAVLEAIQASRVHRLLIADTLNVAGGECARCGRLAEIGEICPACGNPLQPIPHLADRAIRRAIDEGAAVQIVGGVAANRLLAAGGLGAWTRY